MALLSWPYYRSNDAGHHGRASNTGRAGVHSSGNNSLSGTFNAAAIFRNIGNRGSLNPRSMLLICCRQRFVRIASSRCDNLFSRRISAIFCPMVFMIVGWSAGKAIRPYPPGSLPRLFLRWLRCALLCLCAHPLTPFRFSVFVPQTPLRGGRLL